MSIATATCFWIQSGGMQGGSRNQLEITSEFAEFFDSASRAAGYVSLFNDLGANKDATFAARSKEDYEHYVDKGRLSLITERQGGEKYPGRVIHFEKREEGGRYTYILEVADAGSVDCQQWRARSVHVGVTKGGREYGYY